LIFDNTLIASFGYHVFNFGCAKGSFDSHGTGLELTSSDSYIKSSSFLDVNDISIRQLISQLFLAFKLFIKELFVVFSISNVRLTSVAFVDRKGQVARMRNRNDDIDVLLWINFKGELMFEWQVDDLATVDAD